MEDTKHDLNSILLEGSLRQDPILASMPNVTDVCTFEIASSHVTSSESRNPTVSTFSVEIYGALALNCGEYLKKGRGVIDRYEIGISSGADLLAQLHQDV